MVRKSRLDFYVCLLLTFTVILVAFGSAASSVATYDAARPKLQRQFTTIIRPFIEMYCIACHGKVSPQAQLDLASYTSLDAATQDFTHLSRIMDKLLAKQMPPPNAGIQPTDAQRTAVIAWIRAARQYEAERNAGDPGPTPVRRLSNAEYDYTIRDLTGVDLRPAREFPVDPANQEGFDNSGESLTMSSALVKKYAQAAKEIADHMALTTSGMEFASHRVLAETDRDKFCIFRIVNFYKRQPTDLADYFHAAWRYRYRAASGTRDGTLQTVAAKSHVSPRYLELVWKTLVAPAEKVGPIVRLQEMWNALPPPNGSSANGARPGCVAMRDWVVALRQKLAWRFANLPVPREFSVGGQCFVLWKDRQYATHRRMLNPAALRIGGEAPARVNGDGLSNRRPKAKQTGSESTDADLYAPTDEASRAPYLASFQRFCSAFPDAFYISERGRMYEDSPGDKGRLLTAGLHNSMGYFRDDEPLMELILSDDERRELDRLWLDFNTVAFVPERMHLEFFVYERSEARTILDPEFNFAKAEDKSALSDAKIKLLGDLYLAKARRNGGEPQTLQAIEDHFKWVSARIRATEKARLAAEPAHLKALLDFAARAYRRPLSNVEEADLLAFYRELRRTEGLSHEEAVRDTVVSILLSPNFLYRMDLQAAEAGTRLKPSTATVAAAARSPQPAIQPLSDYALASRLSYFLWASMPDVELLRHAAAGDLHRPEVLIEQSRRMLKDSRVRALAVEFGGNWFDFRRFDESNTVDRNRFPSFTDALREAMFEEPVHFLTDEFQSDRSVLDILLGKRTFVNAALARHYGMTDVKPAGDAWVPVNNADRYGRGGLLPMAVFLTQNAPGLRTSPVKRGYWVVRRVLGEVIPPPPPTVPALPADESKMGTLTLRQALEAHRSNPACAGCHARFDSYGLVFEGYGPIGELRSKDLGGKPVDDRARFPGGVECSGVSGLREFIRSRREKDFLVTFDRKLLSYALGRSLQPSDDRLLSEMQRRSSARDYRFGTLVETIVTSPQFRNRRASAEPSHGSLAKTVSALLGSE